MPFGGLLSLGTAAISGASALGGLFGGNDKPQAPPVVPNYQYANMGGADSNAYGGIGGLSQYNVPGQLLPQYMGIAQNVVNNPFANMYQGGAGIAGGYGVGSGMNAFNAGGAMEGSGLNALPDVQALLSLGFDPQNALYSRTQQQVQDQTRAGLEARGIDSTPYGAGVEGQTMSNFNIDWQNNQLGRAAQGAGAAGGLMGQAGGAINQGAGLQAGAAGQIGQGFQMPYSAFNNINTNSLAALAGTGQFGMSGAQVPQQQIQDYLQYLSQGNTATSNLNSANTQNYSAQVQGQNAAFNQNQILGGQLGSALQGFGKAYQAGGFGGGGGGTMTLGKGGSIFG